MGCDVGVAELSSNINVDKTFSDYAKKAQQYLDRDVFAGTPITGEMLANAARETYAKTGKIVPLNLALAQAQFESAMGQKGRNPLTNPYNVGEFDEGTKQRFKTTQEGVKAYYDLMANDYLKDKSPEDLLKNFVNKDGNRYASNKKYEKGLAEQIAYIDRFVGQEAPKKDNNVKTLSSFDKAFAEARSSGKKIFEFAGKKYNTEVK
jgi:hypothetical protein